MRTLILVILVFGIFYGVTQTVAQESNAPFLYYYSPQDQAIVVERADGTDRRLLAKGEMLGSDPIYTYWTPTGEWLIIRSHVDEYTEQAFAVRYDGTAIMEDLGDMSFSRWSPVGNYYIQRTNVDNNTMIVKDLVSQETLLEFQAEGLPDWSSDGRYVYYESPAKAVILGLDGSWTERQIFADPDYMYSSFDFGSRMIYRHPQRETLVMEDIDDGKIVEFPERMTALFSTTWSPKGKYALLYTMNNQEQNDKCCVWLLSVQAEQLDFLDFAGGGFGDYWADDSSWFAVQGNDYQTWWQVDPNTLELERLENPQPTYRGQSPLNSEDYQVSPSGDYAASIPSCITKERPSGKCIIDLQRNQTIFLPVHRGVHSDIEGGLADWHRDDDWIIFEEYTIGKRNSDRYPHTSVAHPIGLYREFDYCPRWFCPRWLPEQVPID